jgi:recombination protein RecA
VGISLEDVVEQTREKFKDNSIVMKLTQKALRKVPAWKTGIPQLDLAIGVGGLPKGRVIEIYGPESSGKTTAMLTTIAQAQKEGAWAWIGDMEHALDPAWCKKLGVDLDKLLISQPSHAEECLALTQHFIETGVIDIVGVDSVASLVPKAELEGEFGESHMGLQARLMSQAMRKLTSIISRTECTAIFINQIRDKIGVRWGSPEVTSGGRALKFYASVRIDCRRVGEIGTKGESIGCTTKFTIKKNKVAPPFRICEAELIYSKGYDLARNLLSTGLLMGVIAKEGRSYSITGMKEEKMELGVGKNSAINFIDAYEKSLENGKGGIYDFIIRKIKEGSEAAPVATESDESEEVKKGGEEIGEEISES